MELERSARYLTSSEVLWAMLSPPEALLWLTGLDDVLPGQSGVIPCVQHEPSAMEAPVVLEAPLSFATGPLTDATVRISLDEQGEDGVTVQVRFTGTPRRSWTEFLTTPRIVKFIEARMERQLDDLQQALSGKSRFAPAPPPLDESARKRIETAFAGAKPNARAAVVARLLRAPLPIQSLLRPAEIAAQDDLSIADVLQTLILGVQHGVLELEWAVLCPQSRNAIEDGERIEQDGAHCAACGVRYETGLHDSMELVFRPRMAIRSERIIVERLMRGRSPKKIGKQRVDIRQSLEFSQVLEAGRYLFESDSGSCVVDVAPEHPVRRIVRFELGKDKPSTSARVPPGKQRIEVVNPLTHVVRLSISKRWRPPFPFTAATLYDYPPTRAMLPAALLAPGCEVFWGAVMVIENEDSPTRKRVQAILRAVGEPDGITRVGSKVVACFRETSTVLLAAEQMAARQLLVGVGIGAGMVNRVRGRIQGQALQHAQQALFQAGRPQFAVQEDSIDAFAQALTDHSRVISLRERPGRSALMVFAAVVDGAPDLEIEELSIDGEPGQSFGELTSIAGCTIIGSLDKGGVGEVYEVERPETGERLAAKILHPHLASKRFIQLFHKEGYYASQLKHPNIVTTHDWGDEEGRPFLLMERLEGHTLYHEVRKVGPISLLRTAQILSAVLAALEVIHAMKLVHRDIKPHNVFLLSDPTLAPHATKLLDFGLMRPAGFSREERFAGTPEFMAPEQVELGDVDARADLYAVGALAFFMHTRRPPFKGRTRGEGAVLRMDGSMPDDLEPEVLGSLTPIIARALKFDKNDRWTDATEMREAMEAAAAVLSGE